MNYSDYILGINMSTGSTGLGLYFGQRIAELHQRNGNSGHIALSNGGALGGGFYSLFTGSNRAHLFTTDTPANGE